MKVLVTGGAGYIGSFMAKQLLDSEHTVVVADSLEKGHKEAVDSRAALLVGDLREKTFVKSVLQDGFDIVIHFAGYIAVGESMREPARYFYNNTFATLNLLEGMRQHKIQRIIFSSTAAVYGNPVQVPIPENHPTNPTSSYGQSKLMTEQLLHWYRKIYDISFVSLRYFNACGAALDGNLGEMHNPETHIIPNAIVAAIEGKKFPLFGDDYQTPDGTCIRDYIHIYDLITAHMLAMEDLHHEKGGFIYNVGTGKGYSNKEVLDMVRKVSGVDFEVEHQPRREGDVEVLIADPGSIQKDLNFSPKYSDLETIVKSAWEWHKKPR